jgi:hypothetical protein
MSWRNGYAHNRYFGEPQQGFPRMFLRAERTNVISISWTARAYFFLSGTEYRELSVSTILNSLSMIEGAQESKDATGTTKTTCALGHHFQVLN